MPWMHLYMSRSKKGMSLTKQSSHTESPQTNGIKSIMWTCIVSAPEMTIMFYSLNGVVLYHVSSLEGSCYFYFSFYKFKYTLVVLFKFLIVFAHV